MNNFFLRNYRTVRNNYKMNATTSPCTSNDIATPNSKDVVPWRERACLSIGTAAAVLDRSTASIYRLHEAGLLRLKRVAGKPAVKTADVIALVDRADEWTSSGHGAAGRAAHIEKARRRNTSPVAA